MADKLTFRKRDRENVELILYLKHWQIIWHVNVVDIKQIVGTREVEIRT